jgi:uncharacterized protein
MPFSLGLRQLMASVLLIATTMAVDARPQRAAATLETTWSASATTAVEVEARTFDNGPVRLSGTLYAPKSARRIPALIAFHGASEPTREFPLYRHLSEMLPPLGIAVFIYDRRGTGKSGGKPANGDYEALAEDGIAAQRLLASDPRIDPKRIGFWGLSQGGWLSLLAASRSFDAAFAISISAPMTTPDVQMNFAVANILRIKGYSEDDIQTAIAARKAVDDFERGLLDRSTAQKRLDAAVSKPWFDLIYMDKTFADPDHAGWAKEIRQDPLRSVDAVRCPMLIVYGARDPWVPAKQSVEALKGISARHPGMSVVVVAGADHTMMWSAPPALQIDPHSFLTQAPESPAYFALLVSWLTAQGFARIESE